MRILPGLDTCSMAHFRLAPGQVTQAVTHRTVQEIWYVISGRGEIWRRQGEREEVAVLEAGVCLTIPLGTHFQFRADITQEVCVVAVTQPPWPGQDEAVRVEGLWEPT